MNEPNITYYATMAQVIPVLLLAGVIELRALDPLTVRDSIRQRGEMLQMYRSGRMGRFRVRTTLIANSRFAAHVVLVGFPVVALMAEAVAVMCTADMAEPNGFSFNFTVVGFTFALFFVLNPVFEKGLFTARSSVNRANELRNALRSAETPKRKKRHH